jgi:surfeit locus 1 family protein
LAWPGVAALVGLGTWQLERLEWKTALISEIEARASAPAVSLPDPGRPVDLERLAFTRVAASGRFLHEHEMLVVAKVREGLPGAHVVTPLVLGDGRAVLVDRGWVPQQRRDPATRTQGQVAGEVRVDGLLRGPQRGNWFTPDNRPGKSVWFSIDPVAMARAAGLAPLPYYVEAGPAANPGGLPVGGHAALDIRNEHLHYAITWYALACGLLVVYLSYRRGERRRAE